MGINVLENAASKSVKTAETKELKDTKTEAAEENEAILSFKKEESDIVFESKAENQQNVDNEKKKKWIKIGLTALGVGLGILAAYLLKKKLPIFKNPKNAPLKPVVIEDKKFNDAIGKFISEKNSEGVIGQTLHIGKTVLPKYKPNASLDYIAETIEKAETVKVRLSAKTEKAVKTAEKVKMLI